MRKGLLLAIGLTLMAAAPAAAKGLQVGDLIPETLGYTPDKTPINRDAFAGKIIVMTFWATWCAPCLKELPVLDRVAQLTDDDTLQVLAVNFKQTRFVTKKVARQLSDSEIVFAHDRKSRLSKAFKVKNIPNLWIIGRDGRVLHNKVGYSEEALPELVDAINDALMGKALPNDAR
ncbi:MAG: TlpA disulfide reductase family protein [Pseudomonadota bacterium]